jgi:hypothetical protein
MRNFRFARLVVSPVVLGAVLAWTPTAHAFVSNVDLGVSYPNITGTDGQRFQGRAGFAVSADFDNRILGPQTAIFGSVQYQPLGIRNMTDGRINLVNAIAGVRTWGTGGALGIQPFVSMGLGLSYAWMAVPNAPTLVQNSAGYFTLQPSAGFDIPILQSIAVSLKLPLTVVFTKPAVVMWGQVLSVRLSL